MNVGRHEPVEKRGSPINQPPQKIGWWRSLKVCCCCKKSAVVSRVEKTIVEKQVVTPDKRDLRTLPKAESIEFPQLQSVAPSVAKPLEEAAAETVKPHSPVAARYVESVRLAERNRNATVNFARTKRLQLDQIDITYQTALNRTQSSSSAGATEIATATEMQRKIRHAHKASIRQLDKRYENLKTALEEFLGILHQELCDKASSPSQEAVFAKWKLFEEGLRQKQITDLTTLRSLAAQAIEFLQGYAKELQLSSQNLERLKGTAQTLATPTSLIKREAGDLRLSLYQGVEKEIDSAALQAASSSTEIHEGLVTSVKEECTLLQEEEQDIFREADALFRRSTVALAAVPAKQIRSSNVAEKHRKTVSTVAAITQERVQATGELRKEMKHQTISMTKTIQGAINQNLVADLKRATSRQQSRQFTLTYVPEE